MSLKKITSAGNILTYIIALIMLFFAREPNMYAFSVGVVVAYIGEFLRLWGAGHLTKNEELTTSGPYAHLKHPLYTGTFLVIAGFLAASISWNNLSFSSINLYVLIFAFAVFVFYYFPYKRKKEADRMIRYFGEEAEHWVKAVPEFLPRLKPYEKAKHKKFSWKQANHNSECFVPLIIAIGFAVAARYWWMGALFGDGLPDWLLGKV